MLDFYLRILAVYQFCIKLPFMLKDCFTYDYSEVEALRSYLALQRDKMYVVIMNTHSRKLVSVIRVYTAEYSYMIKSKFTF